MIPTYDKMMLPILQVIADGAEWSRQKLLEAVAANFRLTDEEMAHRLPSGTQTTVGNRLGWARTRLGKAGLLERTSRGVVRITPAGLNLLQQRPPAITEGLLMQIPAYREWIEQSARRTESTETVTSFDLEARDTPEAIIEYAHRQHRAGVEDELLTRVRGLSPVGFERLVIGLLLAMGYGVRGDGEHIGQSGDEGVDGVIREDRLGLDLVYVQAKRWEKVVGRPEVQGFVGSLAGLKARKGVFITTSGFSREAHDYLSRIETRIVLIDGQRLARLMFENGVGVATRQTFAIKSVDSDFFDEI